jgi:hypothetical protein
MGLIPSEVADEIVDINGKPGPMSCYAFTSVSGAAVSLTGYFVDSFGRQVGSRITPYAITTAVSFITACGGTIPPSAHGFEGTISAALYYNKSVNATNNSIVQSPAAGDPQFAATNLFQLGRVG